MVLRLNPDHPMVWRTPTSVQFGVEAAVARLGSLSPPLELLLDVLARGVSRPLLSTFAANRGVGEAEVDELLTGLAGVLGDTAPAASLDRRLIAVDGCGPGAEAIEALLRQLGAVVVGGVGGGGRAGDGDVPDAGGADRSAGAAVGRRPDLAVIVSHYATSPRRAAVWLRDDVPHLLVEFGDRSARVGPVVSPPAGPCAACLEHHRVDLDPAWVAIACQAVARPAPSADALGVATAAATVGRVATEFFATAPPESGGDGWTTHAVRVRRPGVPGHAITVERVRRHPLCGCRSPRESATAVGPLPAECRPPPTTGRAVRERG